MTHPHWNTTPPPVGMAILVCLTEFEDGLDSIVTGYVDPDEGVFCYENINTTDVNNIKGWYPVPEFR